MGLDPHPIVILGMHRSGTSAVSEAVSRLGVYLGPEDDFYPADANNPRGFFELRILIGLNHRSLDAFQMDAGSVTPLPENWLDRPPADEVIEALDSYLRTTFFDRGRWGFKQPITCLLLPVYQEVFRRLGVEPRYILCVRNPIEVASSELNWAFGPNTRLLAPLGKRAYGVWLRYTLDSLSFCPAADSVVVLYDSLFSRPGEVVDAIVALDATPDASDAQLAEARGVFQSDLRHFDAPLSRLDEWPALLGKTYELCRSISVDREGYRRGSFVERIAELRGAFDAWVSMLRDPPPSLGILSLAWRDRDGNLHAFEKRYFPTPTWQTVELGIEAPPNTVVAGSMYNQPCRIWVRRVHWRFPGGETPAEIQTGPGTRQYEMKGMMWLDAVFESSQLILRTPCASGPYTLVLEFLLETGGNLSLDATTRLADRLDRAYRELARGRRTAEQHCGAEPGW